MYKLSEFLAQDKEIPFLLGAFFSRYQFTKNQKIIYTYSYYKASQKIQDTNFYEKTKEIYLDILNKESELKLWQKDKSEFKVFLENDLNLTKEQFFNKIYIKILNSNFFTKDGKNTEKLKFIRGFFELRGSIDTKMKLLSQDYFFNSNLELKKMIVFNDAFNIPLEVLNFNFRQLQKQYIDGTNKRNTQFRINLYWYASKVGFLNPYKAEIIKKVYFLKERKENNISFFECEPPKFNSTNSFLSKIDAFVKCIYNQDIDKLKADELRKRLKFDVPTDDTKFTRSSNIVEIIKYSTKDECSACKQHYNIKDRSFLTRQDKYYTEIHHIISLGKNKDLDVIDNLTKLCPTCHRALSKGSSKEDFQKGLILNILKNNKNNLEFASAIFDSQDLDYLAHKIYENLK